MKATPFMLIGASALASIESAVMPALHAWAGEWGIVHDAVSVGARRAYEHGVQDGLAWSCSYAQDHHAYFGWHPASTEGLCALMFPPDIAPAQQDAAMAQLAPAAARQAMEALAMALTAVAFPGGGRSPASRTAPGAALYARGAGAVVLSIAVGSVRASLLLDGACVRALAAPAGALHLPPLGKIDLQGALAGTGLTLDLTVGSAQVGLNHLLALAVGDVIRLDTSVEQPVALRLPSGAAVLNGYMGKSGGQLAVELTRLN
ncbi:FliM/FliN family flagellar motor C-terminal domain-containing protein [Massilia sp. Leaf139]|uniref:FliM/FliN family flagellar motor C-terminal domain-containing protein n=1 Tax=Massilia sp. Leaf139 TaxID=1736272 RepID=UPI0006FFCA75|nr:FliM/FliN family flagellar motor C-terminal domain-containing protein [Massilia sp. Leaf139]KQQ96166.1 hypothetical protein ASF77_21935 [Massilia sp. Leaf139]